MELAATTVRPEAEVGERRIQSLDGLRGVAILLVLLFHGSLPGFRNAWIGVDIFFVLSGYLITTVLIREYKRSQTISLIEFYKRRSLRLAPPLFLMCGLFLLLALAFLPNLAARLRETLESILYVSNWSQAFQLKTSKYLGHTWSLGIEEQFYLLWPMLLLQLVRLPNGSRWVFRAALGLAAAAAVWRGALFLLGASPERLYNGFDTRCDTIFIGCALAFVAPRLRSIWPLGLVGILSALIFARWNAPFMFMGGYTLLSVSAALLIAGGIERTSSLSRLLGAKPLVFVGSISYGLYIYHFPVYALIVDSVGWNPWYLNSIGLPIATIMAIVSYRTIERRAMGLRKEPMSNAVTIGLALLGPTSVALGAVFLVFVLSQSR
jgi:peptidoglycan/LPS O-acetylase OafA/YrhL